jgi:aromatic ring-opening dioxygenase catalytic subunit (LigB family)
MTVPTLFLAHGAPTLLLTDTPARAFLQQFGYTLERPKAILVISAHWETATPTVNAVDRNETIHDFGSVQPHLGPAHHLTVGRALAPLRQERVLIIGSGSFTHDLSEFRGHGPNDSAPAWVNSFADWFDAALTKGQIDELLVYRRQAPFAGKNHPTEEHLLPLYAALGAAGENARAERLHASATYSILRMDVYAFHAADAAARGDRSDSNGRVNEPAA